MTALKVGDHVAAEPLHGCRALGRLVPCSPCAVGKYQLCEEGVAIVGLPYASDLPGGFGEYSVYHASSLFKLPRGVSFEAAALIDVLGVGIHALAVGQPKPGDTVIVFGAGAIGLDIIQCLRIAGVTQIIAVAKYPYQLDAAGKAGADELVLLPRNGDVVEKTRALIGDAPVDAVYEAVGGNAQVVNDAISVCTAGGKIVLTGGFDRNSVVDIGEMVRKGLALLPCNSYSVSYTHLRAHET